jgi:hypothetical protein
MTSREPRWRGSPRARAAIAGLALLLGVALPGVHARAETSAPALYQWTDERGNVRYTPDPDRVPASQRGTLQLIAPGAPPPSASPRPAAQPGQIPAPSAAATPAPSAPSAPPAPAPAAMPPPVAAPIPAATPAPAPAPVATPAPVSTPALPTTAAPAATPAPAISRAPATAPAPVAAPAAAAAPAPAAGESEREQQLAAAIAADEEALKVLISAPIPEGGPPLADSAELREIARRLPELQAELSALRERRAPPAGP